tara:strand:+ start:1381 stop:1674 length:294 start_codon:yes stop_codon:yes gene_type:complete
MFFYIFAGIFSACAILFLLAKMDIQKVLAFDIVVDITSTLFLMFTFFGTFAGMMAAMIGGSIISVTLFFIKRLYGYKKLKRKGLRMVWINVPPRSSS